MVPEISNVLCLPIERVTGHDQSNCWFGATLSHVESFRRNEERMVDERLDATRTQNAAHRDFFANGNNGWIAIGDKRSLLDLTISRTRIDRGTLCSLYVRKCNIAMRVSWAPERRTTRIEDQTYYLLDVFNVDMPMLYGKGQRAFLCLQIWSAVDWRA
jgi:hypothetical protein